MDDTFTVRPMRRADLDLALDWAAAEGWNPGLADADCFLRPDPAGFLMASVGSEPAASLSVVRWASDFGFLGFYICPPRWRGRGIGMRLWQAGMAHLGDRVIGLDGVPDQQANYRKSGFMLAHRNVRYAGRVACEALADDARHRLVDAAALPVDRLLDYDRPFFPADRTGFMRCWLRPDRRTSLALIRDGDLCGFGTIRACREGHKIGPLFADDPDAADRLFRGLASHAQGDPLAIDPPETNPAALALARRWGLEPAFETARMYRGPAPDLPINRTFGITTFELG